MGKILLITGAGGGLGSLIARHEAGNFSEIVLLGKTRAPLEKAAQAMENAGAAKAHIAVADVSDEKQVESAISPFSALDGLVNAAGVLGPVARTGEEEWNAWKEAVAVNLVGNAAVCHHALPLLSKSRRGKIVNFSGGGAASPREWHSAYAASKTAIVRFTEILALEHPELDANAIAPGAHNTGIWKTETHDTPPAKWADRQRFCETVSFLLSPGSDGISGKLIHIYDKWEGFGASGLPRDMYTLRRVEPKR